MPATGTDPGGVGLGGVARLRALFVRLVDPRARRGIRHQLASVLTVAVYAALAGAGDFREAADRIADLPPLLHEAAGTRRDPRTGAFDPPSRDTVRRAIEPAERAARVRDGDRDGPWGLAIDGKTVRRSSAPGEREVKLLAAIRHQEAIVIAQVRVPQQTTETTQSAPLLDGIDLAGAVVTADTAHARKATAAYLHARGARYVFTVKADKPVLLTQVIDLLASTDRPDHVYDQHRAGQVVRRSIQVAPAAGHLSFPGVAQAFRLQRARFDGLGRRIGVEIAHGATSLPAHEAGPERIAAYMQGHWGIENKIHRVRDVVFAEDAHHAYRGSATQVMATIRSLAIALIRLVGHQKIKATLQAIAADRLRIPPLLAASRP